MGSRSVLDRVWMQRKTSLSIRRVNRTRINENRRTPCPKAKDIQQEQTEGTENADSEWGTVRHPRRRSRIRTPSPGLFSVPSVCSCQNAFRLLLSPGQRELDVATHIGSSTASSMNRRTATKQGCTVPCEAGTCEAGMKTAPCVSRKVPAE